MAKAKQQTRLAEIRYIQFFFQTKAQKAYPNIRGNKLTNPIFGILQLQNQAVST